MEQPKLVTLDRGDAQLHGTVTGTGSTVLLLHAGGEERSVWVPIAAALPLRSVAYDLRGHGDSTGEARKLQPLTADVTAMIRREPAPIVVVGASLGGLAAIASLGESPQDVAGLILVDVVPDPDAARVRAWLDARGLRDHRAELVEDIFDHSHELLAAAGRLSLPILLVRGGQTSPLGDPEVDRFRAVNPTVTVTRVLSAGHLVARDAPAELARIIADQASTWLAGSPG